jgi:hypothetical protein
MFGSNSNSKDPLAVRRSGVRTSQNNSVLESQNASSAEPQKLLGLLEAKVIFVRFTNERGVEETGMFFDVEGQLVSTSDTAEWTKRLAPMSGWLEKQVRTKMADKAPETSQLPTEDTVDVVT